MPYWNEGKSYRWDYMAVAIRMMKSCGNNTLEMGTMRLPLNDKSYIFDIDKLAQTTKRGRIHDLNDTPYEWLPDNCFDCACGLQVFEHLENQPQVFAELCRISRNVVLSFPYRWTRGDYLHKGIDDEIIAEWTCHKEPDDIVLIKNRIIYFWKNTSKISESEIPKIKHVYNGEYNKQFYDVNYNFQKILSDELSQFLISEFHPRSIVDFGCGCGFFLSELARLADTDNYLGYNLDHPKNLKIDQSQLILTDMSSPVMLIKNKFDLVVSLEVAEHIPKKSANIFIDSLVRHGNRILFAAATPGQGGTGHVNEQPHEYWHKKFASHGYKCLDIIRPRIKGNKHIPFWYRKNIFIYERDE